MEDKSKVFYRSKIFWQNLTLIVGGVGSLFTGEMTIEQVLPKLAVAILGIVGLIARWNTDEKLGFGK